MVCPTLHMRFCMALCAIAYFHTRMTADSAPREPPVLPSQATRPGQPLRLPGQTRVAPEEYTEFRNLGHGEIFNLDVDACAALAPAL